jgi:ribosomal protein S18 acetylase RimI-like enzyme
VDDGPTVTPPARRPDPGVRLAGDADLATVADALVRAFDDDPVANYFFPSARRRPAGLRAFFFLQMRREALPYSGVYTTTERQGAAIWLPPGKPAPTGLAGLVSFLPLVRHVIGNLPATMRLLAALDRHHPKEPHWYLATLGTDPAVQGRGIGSALLQPVLRSCDKEGRRAYLESSKESNLPFYRRHGFEVSGTIDVPGAPPLWTMWRDPVSPAG